MYDENAEWDGKIYFEITGIPGRIYVEDLVFGTELKMDVGGHNSSILQSPAMIYPAFNANQTPLHKYLDTNFGKNGSGSAEKTDFQECLIGVEKNDKVKRKSQVKYQLLKLKVLKIYDRHKYGTSHYRFEFGDFNVIRTPVR